MRRIVGKGLLSLLAVMFAACTCIAQDVNPNGFPNGPHYNLNILGKKDGFACPQQEYDPLTGLPIYGNSVFVPENGTGIQIYMESGSAKGRLASTFTELRAVDPCAVFDGSPARIQLPPNANGYRVYARALAKPTYSPTMTITPNLSATVDENGNDLFYLGLVTSNGWTDPYGNTTRIKGKSKAVPITGIFQWSGTVCYLSPPDPTSTPSSQRCCVDAFTTLSDGSVVDGPDGIYESCELPVIDPATGISSCTAGVLTDVYCVDYTSEWVFNIADFVEYFWSLDNSGSKLVQIRFYPN